MPLHSLFPFELAQIVCRISFVCVCFLFLRFTLGFFRLDPFCFSFASTPPSSFAASLAKVSHQWAGGGHPDPEFEQFKVMQTFLAKLMQGNISAISGSLCYVLAALFVGSDVLQLFLVCGQSRAEVRFAKSNPRHQDRFRGPNENSLWVFNRRQVG